MQTQKIHQAIANHLAQNKGSILTEHLIIGMVHFIMQDVKEALQAEPTQTPSVPQPAPTTPKAKG